MQNISFRRKLKHIWKEYQRSKSISDMEKALKELGIGHHGLLNTNFSIPYVLNKTANHSKRFTKLCNRLGKKARSQGKTVSFTDIIKCLRDNGDARLIPFRCSYDVVIQFVDTIKGTVVANNEEEAKRLVMNYPKKDFEVKYFVRPSN